MGSFWAVLIYVLHVDGQLLGSYGSYTDMCSTLMARRLPKALTWSWCQALHLHWAGSEWGEEKVTTIIIFSGVEVEAEKWHRAALKTAAAVVLLLAVVGGVQKRGWEEAAAKPGQM